jgi:hypothetical protein
VAMEIAVENAMEKEERVLVENKCWAGGRRARGP